METKTKLGKLARMDLRNIWEEEDSDFTPWLAREENLSILADTLGVELELEGQEQSVGPFRADILCKDTTTGNLVLIENQLERTDHRHLGQLLTYASGLEAVTIVWIASEFNEEHRATLDWLNKITDEKFQFFGLEVELWRIDDSRPAPKFNIVSKPNDWSKSVKQAAREILSETEEFRIAYWEALHEELEEIDGRVSGERKALPNSWMDYSVGKSGYAIRVTISTTKNQIRVIFRDRTDDSKEHYGLLHEQKNEIEAEFGGPLNWEERPDGQACHISCSLDSEIDLQNRENWPNQHRWIAEKLNALHKVFAPRVKEL